MNQYILRFQISMSYPVLHKLSKPIHYLEEKFHSLFFIKSSKFSEACPQSSTLGQFQDNVEIVDSLMNIIKFDDVWTFQFLVDLYFRIESVLGVLVFKNFVFVHHFDCNLGLCFFFNAKIDLRESSRAKFVAKVDDVLTYSFFCAAHQL